MLDIDQPWFLPQLCCLIGGTLLLAAAATAWSAWPVRP